MTETSGLPSWLAAYASDRLENLRQHPMDQRSRGELRGACDSAVLRGEMTEAVAKDWLACLPSAVAVGFRSSVTARAITTGTGRTVRAPGPVPPVRRRVEPDRAIVVDALIGEMSGNPVRLVGVGLFPDAVHLAISLVKTPELWALDQAAHEWRESLRNGERRQLSEPPPYGASVALRPLFQLADDLGTDYRCGSSGAGGSSWAILLDLRFSPAPPSQAGRLVVSLLNEDASPISETPVPLATG